MSGVLLGKLPPGEAAASAVRHYADKTAVPGLGPDGRPQPGGPEDVINLIAGLCFYCRGMGVSFDAVLQEAGRRVARLRNGAGEQGARVVTA